MGAKLSNSLVYQAVPILT